MFSSCIALFHIAAQSAYIWYVCSMQYGANDVCTTFFMSLLSISGITMIYLFFLLYRGATVTL